MIRTLSFAAAIAALAGSASAAFLGIELREDKSLPPATGLAGFPETPPRVFNLYAKFDGGVGDDIRNTVLSLGQPDTESGIGINLSLNPGANFYQSPGAAGGANGGVGGNNLDGAGDNRRLWTTFVSVGVKAFNSDYGPIYTDSTSADPDFGFVNRDGIGTPALQANDIIRGGWFNSNPPGLQGAPVFNPSKGTWETFLAQVSIKDLAPGASAWAGGGEVPNHSEVWLTNILEGRLTVFTQGGEGEDPAIENFVSFEIPSPGAAALFGLAGLATLRRRRA